MPSTALTRKETSIPPAMARRALVYSMHLQVGKSETKRYGGEYEAIWKLEFKLSWRKATLPKHLADLVDSDQ